MDYMRILRFALAGRKYNQIFEGAWL